MADVSFVVVVFKDCEDWGGCWRGYKDSVGC